MIDKQTRDKINEHFLNRMCRTWNPPYGMKDPNTQALRLSEYREGLAYFKPETLEAAFIELRDNVKTSHKSWPPISDCVRMCRLVKNRTEAGKAGSGQFSRKAMFEYVKSRQSYLAEALIARFPEISEAWDNPMWRIQSVAMEAARQGAMREYIQEQGHQEQQGPDWPVLPFLERIMGAQLSPRAANLAGIEHHRLKRHIIDEADLNRAAAVPDNKRQRGDGGLQGMENFI